jgi:hypothetical protein
MTRQLDIERVLDDYLAVGANELADHVLDAALDDIDHTPQRRSWWPTRGVAHTIVLARTAIAAAAVLVVAIVGYSSLPGNGTGAGPTPAPTASPIPLPTNEARLSAGTYALRSFPVGITFEVPAGWISCSDSEVEQSVCHQATATSLSIAVSFLIVDDVVADPCSPDKLDPPVGPSVADLVTAISGLDGFKATAPVNVTVDGFSGEQFTVAAPTTTACDLKTWATVDRTNGVGPGEINLLDVLDVDGTRVVIAGAYHPENPAVAEDLAAIQQIMASVHIEP